MHNRFRWTFLLTLAAVSLVAAPIVALAQASPGIRFGVRQGASGAHGEKEVAQSAPGPVFYDRHFQPVLESMPHIIAGSEAIGSDYLQTAGGFIRVSRLSEGPRFFRSALSVDDLGPNDVFVVHYGTASMETVRQTLRSARVTPLAPLPNNAAVVRGATPYALATIARAGFTTLAWTPGFIISPLVGATPMLTPQQAASSNLSMVAQVFPGADMDSAGSLLAGMGGTVTGQFNNSITFQIDINDLRSNAGMVRGSMFSYIGEQMPVISADEDTIAGVEIAEFRNGARPYHDALVDGRGVIVGVTDTGISLDAAVLADTAGGSTDIIGLPAAAAGPTHRKVVAYVRAQDVPGSGGLGDLESCDGVTAATHGHLVASLIAGNAKDVVPDVRVLSGLESNLTGSATKHAVDGVASGSKIYFVDDQLSAGCSNPEQIEAQTPGLLSANTAASKAAGARIHNFSFSVLGSNSAYDANAADIDSWLVANKDFLVVVAAGNQGTDLLSDGNLDFNSITSPGTAKNVVTVGSTANVDNALDPTNSVIPNVVNNGIETISRFQGGRASGQGPAAQTTQSNGAVDWRIKPDVMAPGDEFGNQRLTAPTTCLSSDNDQVGGVECNRQLPGIFEGTSFAAAAASGAAADIASYFDQGFQPNGQAGISAAQTLSGAELKAALIASTDLMTGNPSWEQLGAQVRLGFYNPKHLFPFTPEQGYGRIQLDKLLPLNSEPGTPAFISSETVNLASPGSSVTRTFTVLDPGQAFRVAAAWYDPAAIAGAMSQGKLIQDVDLTVTDCGPDGICGVPGAADDTIYNGNFFSEDKNYDGSLTEIPIDFVCDNDPAKPCDPGAFDPPNDCFSPPDPNCGGADPSACNNISCLPTNVITEDCNGDGALNFDEFSLPVEGTGCEAGARDRNNNNEAVFLSPAQLAQGRTFQAALDYASSSEVTTTAAMVGLVVTGGVTQGVSPNIVRLNKAEYTCSDSLNISILDGAQDSSTSLLPVQVTLVSKRPDNTIVDTESGWAYTAAAGAPSIRFTSQLAATLDEANQTPSNNNQIVSVVDGGTITVTYADTIDPDGAGPLSVPAAATATATVRCAPAVNILNIARRGTNARFGVTGGCDPRPRFDPRAIAFGLIPGTGGAITGDLFLDKNEDLIYSVGFLNTELGDALVDVTATLKVCGLPPFTAPATGLTEADIKAGTCPTTSAIEIKNNTVRLGTIQTGKAQTASFPIHVANNVIFPQQVAMVFEVSADRNGLTASSQTVFFHVLDTDTWSRADEDPAVSGVSYYSTDFPTGGREVRLYAGEAISTFPNLGPETFVFQDMVTAPATNSMLGTADGSGTIPNNWPWDFDPDDEGFLARRRFDSKPEGNADLTSNVWQYNNTGECGFQSNGPTDTDGQGGNGGMWHTGFAQSMAGTPPTQSGFDLGCEDFSVPGGADPRREQVLDVISSPRFFRVHQNKDGNGFEYQVEFLRLAMNIQEDLPDGNVIMALELDPDTKTPSPVDALDFGWLASDQGTEGFLQGSSQIPYFVFNPNDPHEVTSVEAVLGTLNETPDADPLAPSASQNIRKIHGPGSAGSFFDPNDPNKAPARQYGEIPGVFGSGRGMGVPARRGAGGLPVRNFDSALIELGGGSLEDTFGPNETRSPLQVFPISATNSEVLANRRDSYQVNVIAFLRESEDPLVPAAESYGYGVDDVVVEWREQHPIADRTPCSNPSTWATRSVCSNDNTVACTTDADCGLGTCNLDAPLGQPSANPAKTSGCADISWDRVSILDPETALTLQVIDRNAQFGPDGTAGTGDEQAKDGLCGDLNGLPEVTVNVNAPGIDQQGEVFCLEETAPNTNVYRGIVKVSSKAGLTSDTDGVIFIQENGDGNNPTTVTANYADADINVTGVTGQNVPCPDNPRQASVSTQFVGKDVLFVTAQVIDDPSLSPNNDGDSIADAGETVDLRLTAVNGVLDVVRQKVDLENVTLTLVTNDPDVACIINGSSSFGMMPSGIAKQNEGADYRVVIGNTKRTSPSQVLQAEFSLGIQGEFTDSQGIARQVTSFATPQRFAINLDLDVSGTATPLAGDFACQGSSVAALNGNACTTAAQCGSGGVCAPLPVYLQSGTPFCDGGTGKCSGGPDDGQACATTADCSTHALAGQVGYFEGFEGSPGRTNSFGQPAGGPIAGTSFRHQAAIRPGGFGYLQQRVVGFSTGAGGPGSGEGLTPGSLISGPDVPQGSSAVDGSRCQQHDPQGPQKANRSESRCRPFEFSSWHVVADKAFSGTQALYAGVSGIDAGAPDASFDGTFTGSHQAAFTKALNIGVAGGATLSLYQIVQTTDDRTFNVPSGQAAGRGYLEVAPADSAGNIAGAWTKIAGFQNNYGNTAVQPFFVNCIFGNYDEFYDAAAALGGTAGFDAAAVNVVGVEYNADDVSSEDDYFDPNDPTRALGPSNGCFPQFVYSSLGDYTSTNTAIVGKAFTKGRLGSNGNGVWINSLFSLDQFAGRSIIVRFVMSDIDIAPGLLWIDIFGNALGNAFRGWILDDVAVSGLVDAPLTLVNDPRSVPLTNACPVDPDPSTPLNENACGFITADAGPDQIIPVSGATVTLDANNSTPDQCVNGFLQYRWRIGATILQDFSTSSVVVDAPATTTLYTVDVQCSTDPACQGSDSALVIPADQVAASSTAGGLMSADLNGAITAVAPPNGSVGGPFELFMFRTNAALVTGSAGDVSSKLCDLGNITPAPIAAGTAAPPFTDSTATGTSPGSLILWYLAAARTTSFGSDVTAFDVGDFTGPLGDGEDVGSGTQLLSRGALQITTVPATARGNCP